MKKEAVGGRWVKLASNCPKCKKNLYADRSATLTSMPPQYRTMCLDRFCDYTGYVLCDGVIPYEEPLVQTKKSGCILTVLGCFTLFFLMFAFWTWVQFIKLCNYLISIGW